VKDLRLIWDSTKVAAEGAPQTPMMEDPSAPSMRLKELLERHRPKGFDEVLGQKELVSTLAKRVTTKDHSRHIVLHGPEGSGKLTLARLYAQALQCVEPTPTGSPCQRCDPCLAFDPIGGNFDYIEIDAKTHGDIEHARYLRDYLPGHMWTASMASTIFALRTIWSAAVICPACRCGAYVRWP
jgi:hypothetical protein